MFKISSVHRVFVAALLTFCAGFDGLSQYNLTIEQSAPAAGLAHGLPLLRGGE